MIQSFRNQGSRDLFDREDSKAARRICSRELWETAARKLDSLNQAQAVQDLRMPH